MKYSKLLVMLLTTFIVSVSFAVNNIATVEFTLQYSGNKVYTVAMLTGENNSLLSLTTAAMKTGEDVLTTSQEVHLSIDRKFTATVKENGKMVGYLSGIIPKPFEKATGLFLKLSDENGKVKLVAA